MTILIVAILILASLITQLIARKRLAIVLQVSALTWVMLTGCGITSKIVMDTLETYPQVSSPKWKQNNVIILLSGGSFRWNNKPELSSSPFATSRILEAARLYFLCKKQSGACKILPTGGDPRRKGIAEGKIMANHLMDLGIQKSDILVEDKSKNTYENAKLSAPLIKTHGFDQIYLVTSGSHLKRSLILFNHFKVRALPSPSDKYNPRFNLIPKTPNMYWTDIGLHEYGGIAKFYFYDFMGWEY